MRIRRQLPFRTPGRLAFRGVSTLSLLVLAACASSPPAASYKAVPPEDAENVEKIMCEKVTCVYDAHITLKQKDGTTFDQTYRSLPVVETNGVSVYAGQTVQFEADVDQDHLVNFRYVTSMAHPEKTLTATLTQDAQGSMTLTMRNPFDRNLKIAMGIMPLDKDSLFKTSSCPVIAKGGSFELWPYPVFQVWLSDMRLLDDPSQMICGE